MVKRIALASNVFIAIILLYLVWPTASFGQDLAELEIDHALTFDVATPHIDWAKPYARGKIRLLFFTDGRGTNPRECVELMQRFDIQGKAIFYARIVDSKKSDWHGGTLGIQRMDNLLGESWDAFVFLGISPDMLPEAQHIAIARKVLEGSGLVLSGVAGNPKILAKANTLPVADFIAGAMGGATYKLGKGRVARLTSRPDIPFEEVWRNDYETWQEQLGRIVLWAARREPQGRLMMALPQTTFDRSTPPTASITVTGMPNGGKLRLKAWVRGLPVHLQLVPDTAIDAKRPVMIPLHHLPEGRYHLDAQAVGPKGVETWGTVSFTVKSERRVASVRLDREWGEPGEKLTGQIILEGTPLPGETLRVSLLDQRRRELARQVIGEPQTRKGDCSRFSQAKIPIRDCPFTFEIQSWMPMLLTVEARLFQQNQEVSRSYRYAHVTKRSQGRFNFLMWDVPKGILAPDAEAQLARTGVKLQLAGEPPPPYVAAQDIAWVPYTTRITTYFDEKGVMKPFCWNDEEAVKKHVASLAEKYSPSRQHGVFAYSLGDENDTKGACLSPHCTRAYRDYLREVYCDLDALNRSWGTTFTDWEQAGLSKTDDNEEKGSFESGNYPRWFDRQAFKSWNYVQYCRKYAQAYEAIDPQAKTGFEGAGRFAGGDDIDLIVRHLGFWSPYPGTTDEVIRSIAPREFPRANWMGYTKDADSLLREYWRMVTRGMDAVWWWRWECIGRFHGWLAPDLRPYPAVKEILEDTKAVREGLGDLLLQSRMRDDGIAILYSYPSTFAHKLDEGAGFGDYEKAHVAWHKAIRDLGLQFSYVTDRMLRLGEFDSKRFRVLVLPRTEAIGDKEAEVIRAFVEKGGVVIADTRPGVYDDRCKKRVSGVLDGLFGVHRIGYPAAKTVSSTDKKIKVVADPGVVAADGPGRAAADLNGVPALILNKVGKGYALLLNGDLNVLRLAAEIVARFGLKVKGARQAAATGASQFDDAPLGAILQGLAGIEAKIALSREDGSAMRDMEVIRWENGKNGIVALFRQGGKGEPVTVTLPKAGYVYDLRNRRSVGFVREFKTQILPNRASFFAVTPKAAPAVKMQLVGDGRRGKVVRARLSVPDAQGAHAVVVTARFPSSPTSAVPRSGDFFPCTGYTAVNGSNHHEKRVLLKRVALIGNDPVTVDLPIAFNDPPGDYEISVTELFTNKTVTKKLTVQ